ncbi:MAG: four helix bundle protein [Nitrospinae bacterium]|nr:four helix bundle protein [Nitrospinota bacterium]
MGEKEDALTKTYDLMLWLFPHIGKFPRDYRFILGDRMQNCLLDVCGQLIEARFSKEKREILKTANIELEKLRYMVRLCKDLPATAGFRGGLHAADSASLHCGNTLPPLPKLLDFRRYEYAAEAINGIGVYIGGWLKKTGKQ